MGRVLMGTWSRWSEVGQRRGRLWVSWLGVERGIERIDPERLEAFVRVASAIVGDRDLAADVVQDGFARAFLHAGAFRGDGSA